LANNRLAIFSSPEIDSNFRSCAERGMVNTEMDPTSPNLVAKLSARQRQCLLLVREGYSSKEIARKLGISPSTVDSHIGTATQLLGFDDRRQAARTVMPDYSDETVALLAVGDPAKQFELFRFPPLGGRVNTLTPHARMLHIVQIALIALVALGVIMLIISGIVALLRR
jgi:DNA-binding CsgD family transcriptional regulator